MRSRVEEPELVSSSFDRLFQRISAELAAVAPDTQAAIEEGLRQILTAQERRSTFDRVLARISADFVSLPPDQVDEKIEAALGEACRCCDADLATLLLWDDPRKSSLTVTHEWDSDSVGGPHFRGAVLLDEYPWLAARLRQGSALAICRLDDFPPEAAVERAGCEQLGIQSVLWVPFEAGRETQGYVAVNTIRRARSWSGEVVEQFHLLGEVFANALARQRVDVELAAANAQVRKLRDRLEAENVSLREEVRQTFEGQEIVGKSHVLTRTLQQMELVAATDSTVFVLGETGTGKGLVARAIHAQSQRRDQPLITVNCAALPPTLIESELFGHEKGAFTGAVGRKLGRFELAHGGTIFLDEIGDLPPEMQVKLLRVLQDGEFERVGSSKTRKVDVRVIAATNRDLDHLVQAGSFRADLYYRLGVFPMHIPALRERRDDIPLLVWYIIGKLQGRIPKRIDTVPPRAMDALKAYDWPGNVRELENLVERAVILSPGTSLELEGILPVKPVAGFMADAGPQSLQDVEREHIIQVLEKCHWRVRGDGGAAERLGMKRTTLQSRMKKLGIVRPSRG